MQHTIDIDIDVNIYLYLYILYIYTQWHVYSIYSIGYIYIVLGHQRGAGMGWDGMGGRWETRQAVGLHQSRPLFAESLDSMVLPQC